MSSTTLYRPTSVDVFYVSVVPVEDRVEIAVHQRYGHAMCLCLTGAQFEALRNAMWDFAANGRTQVASTPIADAVAEVA